MLKRIDLQIKQQSHGLDSKLNQQDLLSLNPRIILYMIEFFIDLDFLFCCNSIQNEKFLEGFEENLCHF